MLFWIPIIIISLIFALLLAIRFRFTNIQTQTRQIARESLRQTQLDELEANLENKDITDEEAKNIKAEIERAYSRSQRLGEDENLSTGPKWPLIILLASSLIAAAFFYSKIGLPGLQDWPLAKRAEIERPHQEKAYKLLLESDALPDEAQIDDQTASLLQELENLLKERDDDPQGWQLLADTSHNIGRYKRAGEAQARYIELIKEKATSQDYAKLAEAYILTVNGYISPEAEAAIRRSLTLDRTNPVARFYAAMTMKQEGDRKNARLLLEGLLKSGVPNPNWQAEIERQIAELAPAPGPSAEDIANANEMSEEDRQAMIGNMVEGLKARLADEGGLPEEWARLINALRVLGRDEEAAAILGEAKEKFPDHAEIQALK